VAAKDFERSPQSNEYLEMFTHTHSSLGCARRCRRGTRRALLALSTAVEHATKRKIRKFDNIGTSKEDLHGERLQFEARMFRYYPDLIRLRRANFAARSHYLDVIHAFGPSHVVAFIRGQGGNELLVVASLNNDSFTNYLIRTESDRLTAGDWQETFNSDSEIYGGKKHRKLQYGNSIGWR
jgi:1,4-alpha-glucan branching enzyme